MKTDFKKHDTYQAKHGKFSLLTLPSTQYLAVDGRGDPNTSADFAHAFEKLYPVAYALKFMSKQELDKDYVVPPSEALWWADDYDSFITRDKSAWQWTLMLMVPEWLSENHFGNVCEALRSKKPDIDFEPVQFMTLDEGLSVQTLHIGPYDAEGPLIAKMHNEFMPANNFKPTGKHHEIYLSDMRRVSPDKLRTIIRQPVTKL